jgi:hypothetical protein
MGGERRIIGTALAMTLVAGGCIGGSSLDFGTPVNIHVWSTPTTVEIDAPGWLTDVSVVYLCHAQPPRLPEEAALRVGWVPGDACQDVGTFETADGLKRSIPVDAIDPARRPAFDAASDWYLLLVARDGDRATSTISSRFHAPPGAGSS